MDGTPFFKLSEYAFVAGLIALGLALLCYLGATALARTAARRPRLSGAGAGAGAGAGSIGIGDANASLAAAVATYGTLIGWLALAFLTVSLVLRTLAVGHGPFANQYEFAVSFAWGVLAVYLFFERRYRLRTLGLIALPIALAMLVYATTISSAAEPLVPALQNNLLLTVHVAVAIVAYGSFSIAFAASLLYLVQEGALDRVLTGVAVLAAAGFLGTITLNLDFATSIVSGVVFMVVSLAGLLAGRDTDLAGPVGIRGLPRPEILDEIAYRAVVIGFPFLTLVIVLGALWAEVAWGTYWNWDPKETASLVTWLIYGAYLHARVVRGWRGRRAAWLLMLGFGATLFTYFGNLFFGGLHSYSGLTQN